MERLQLGPARLLEHNPRLIVASGKGYGSTGPYAHMSAMDITVQAMSGAAGHRRGRRAADQGRRRVRRLLRRHPPVRAISAALFQRERTGRGQIVEVSMHDTIYRCWPRAWAACTTTPTGSSRAHREPPPGMAVAPYNIYETSDGWLAIICISERHWRGVATALGRPELIDDPRFRERADGSPTSTRSTRRCRPAPGPAPAPSVDLQAAGVPWRRSSRSVRSTPTST